MARINCYVPAELYAWWRDEAPDVVPSDFVREGLVDERHRRSGCHHAEASCAACGAPIEDVRT